MKRIFTSFRFLIKAGLLLLLIIFGWVFVSYENLAEKIRGKKSDPDGKNALSGLWGPENAHADLFIGSTPFLAYYDGKEFKLENDILCGRPKGYHFTYELARVDYEDGRIGPDLYKITAPVKPHNGRLLFQIQEIEPEESHIDRLELKRVLHPENTEVIVDSEYRKYYVFNKSLLEAALKTPEPAAPLNGDWKYLEKIKDPALIWQAIPNEKNNVFLRGKENMEVVFSGMRKNETPYLFIKTWFRDWIFDDEKGWQQFMKEKERGLAWQSFFRKETLVRIPAAAAMLLAAWFLHRKAGWELTAAALPLLGGTIHCFKYEYKDESGEYQKVAVNELRAWKYNTEVIEFPREAVRADGTMRVRISASKKHACGFVGAIQEEDLRGALVSDFEEIQLRLQRAYHNRTKEDVTAVLNRRKRGDYVTTIPGDVVDLEFEAPSSGAKRGMKATYLMRSSGFYTRLSKENKKLSERLGWPNNLSEEGKKRLVGLKPVLRYPY